MPSKIIKPLFCILFCWFILPNFSFAQLKTDAKTVSLITDKSVRIKGNLLSKRGDTIMVETSKKAIFIFDVKKLLQISYYDAEGYEIGSSSRDKLKKDDSKAITVQAEKPKIDNTKADTIKPNQPKSTDVIIEIREGGTLKGKLLSRQNDTVTIDIGASKTVSLAIKDIKSISQADEKGLDKPEKGSYYSSQYSIDYDAPYKNPAAARGVLMPNGMPLEKGDSYYQNLFGFLFHNFGFYLGDNFNLAVGTATIPVIGYINPNFNFKVVENLYLGGGGVFWFSPENTALQGFGSVAVGSRDHNMSLKLGQTFNVNDDFGPFQKGLTYSVAAQTRILNNWSVAAELLAISPKEELNIVTVGVRYTRPRIALDFGLGGVGEFEKSETCRNCEANFIFGIPYVAFSVKIGKRRR